MIAKPFYDISNLKLILNLILKRTRISNITIQINIFNLNNMCPLYNMFYKRYFRSPQ